jgi:hypothetical protein
MGHSKGAKGLLALHRKWSHVGPTTHCILCGTPLKYPQVLLCNVCELMEEAARQYAKGQRDEREP